MRTVTAAVYEAFHAEGWDLLPGWEVEEISLDGHTRYRVTESAALAARLGVPVVDGPGRRGPAVMGDGRFWAGDVGSITKAEAVMLAAETRHDNEEAA